MGKGKKRKHRTEVDVPGHVLIGAILDEQEETGPAYGIGQTLTPAMRELFGDPLRYAAARYGSPANAAAAAAWRPGPPGEPMPDPVGPLDDRPRAHICTRPDACLIEPLGAPQPAPETAQQRATRLDREREDARRAYSAAVYAADEAWRELGGRP